MRNLKCEIEDFTETVAQIKFNLSKRTEYDQSEFFSQDDTQRLANALASLNEFDLYTDYGFEGIKKIMKDLIDFVGSIELSQRGGGINDDPESLHALAQEMKDLADKSKNLGYSSKSINSQASPEIFKLCEELENVSEQVAFALKRKSEILEEYFR